MGIITGEIVLPLVKAVQIFYAAKMSYNIFGVRITDEDQTFK